MNPFIMLLMNLIQSNPQLFGGFGGGLQQSNNLMPNRNPMSAFNQQGAFSPFGNLGIGRSFPWQGGTAQRPPFLQPTNEPPVSIPAPQPVFAPVPQPVFEPTLEPPMVPGRGMVNPPFMIEPLPGIRVPINMTGLPGGPPGFIGLPGQGQNTLPARPSNPNAQGLPAPQRPSAGRTLYTR